MIRPFCRPPYFSRVSIAIAAPIDRTSGLGHYQATWKPQPLLLPAGRAPGGRAWAVAVTIVLAVGGGAFYWHHTSKGEAKRPLAPPPVSHVGSEFEGSTADLAFNPCPRTWNVSNGFRVRLAQLGREACYTDAIVDLGRALLDAGYPREAANSLRTFGKRCGSATEVLPIAYSALERINDFSGALEVASELVEALPADGTVRYWRALAYDRTGQFSRAMLDYMNTVQLMEPQKTIFLSECSHANRCCERRCGQFYPRYGSDVRFNHVSVCVQGKSCDRTGKSGDPEDRWRESTS